MIGSDLQWNRLSRHSVVAAGLSIMVSAVAVDVVRGDLSLGIWQVLLASLGLAVVLNGAELGPDAERVRDWLRTPAAVWAQHAAKLAGVTLQLALLVLVIRQFEIENAAFYDTIAVLTLVGFVFHFFVPSRHRLLFFLLLSLAGVMLVLGASDAFWLLGIGFGLLGLCHLPVPFFARVGLLLLAGGLLAALRVEWLQAPWSRAVWPILGSIFMFRLIVYLYDLRHSPNAGTPTQRLSYFFLLPNVAFPLFPVVDYSTFRRTYYNADQFWIYQRGVEWMLRGIVHLLLYRFLYLHLALSPSEVVTTADLGRYLVVNFLLYVRVSGQFHLIVGLLHLFGFHLPETNHRYFLSSGFTDFWRRINIYWKDFVMKVFYYPAYFRLRRWGDTTALVLATLLVILVTWLLHSYQWFWLLGSFPLLWTDALFWAVLAALLVGSSLYEVKHGRKRTLAARTWSWSNLLPATLRTTGTFATICILWSLWTTPSFGDWLSLWKVEGGLSLTPSGRGGDFAVLPVLIAGAVVMQGAVGTGVRQTGLRLKIFQTPNFYRSVAVTTVGILAVYLLGRPEVSARFGERADDLLGSLRQAELNQSDTRLLTRGYYENLIGVSRLNSQLWEVYMKRPPNMEYIAETEAGRSEPDYFRVHLQPSKQIVFGGAVLTTNRWAMRDAEYTLAKPADTYRIATVGASTTMGWSVANNETFEQLVEDRLNRERQGEPYGRYESLNFSVPGYTPIQYLGLLDRMLSFDPDAIFVVSQWNDYNRTVGRMADLGWDGTAIPFDTLARPTEAAKRGATSADEMERRLYPGGADYVGWIYRQIVARSRERGVIPVWIYLPGLEEAPPEEEIATLFRLAEEAGFVMLDLSDVYANRDPAALVVSAWDFHPNLQGHRLIADRLYRAIEEQEAMLFPSPRADLRASGSR